MKTDTRGTSMDFGGSSSLGDLILLAISRQRRCLALFLLISKKISLIWMERNAMVFRDRWTMAPTTMIWRRVGSNLDAIWIRTSNPRISNTLSRDIILIRCLFDEPSVTGDLPLTTISFLVLGWACSAPWAAIILWPVGCLLLWAVFSFPHRGGRVSLLGATLFWFFCLFGAGFRSFGFINKFGPMVFIKKQMQYMGRC